jgi:S1-C subfamily serine protease
MVTNYHVFEKASGDSWGVFGADGKAYRVTGIVAASKSADAAVFQVDGKGLVPLALGGDAPVGESVSIISHPDGRLFFHTSGEVARYAKAPRRKGPEDTIWMDVTAEYAKGSSGGPVMNPDGRVVGMVSNTQSITYGPPGKKGEPTGPHQMVIRNCVPVAAIRALTTAPAKGASER